MSTVHKTPPSGASLRDPTALLSGLLFVAVGVGFLIIGSGYAFGTARSMGPGYFPRFLSLLLIGLGVCVALSGRSSHGEPVGRINWKGVTLVPLAALVFAALIRPAGVAPAIFVAVMLSTFATPTFSWGRAVFLAFGLAAFSSLIFVKGLGLPIQIFGPWFGV